MKSARRAIRAFTMISKLYVAESQSFSAPENLAAEAALTDCIRPGEAVLYLWQNEKTVVIGRNQNAWKECRLASLSRDGGMLVRRLSGGGAVFHDLGNLNVSFCLSREDEDIPRQTQVILNALQSLGIDASRSGRNDLEVGGRKFSGHAFWREGTRSCHHATLMLKVDQAALEKYLCASPLKLSSRGVDSVRARVINLSERYPALTLPALCGALKQAFGEEYALPVIPFPWEDRFSGAGRDRLEELKMRFSSWEWTFGRRIPFDLETQARFSWGEVTLQLHVQNGRILGCRCCTDAMDPVWPGKMEEALQNVRFTPEDIHAVFSGLPPASEPMMRKDLESLILKMAKE